MTATAYAPGYEFAGKAGYDDSGFQGLPAANVRQPGQFDQNEFETVPNVPVFAEHETVAHNGRQLRFGRGELSAIVERCNRRISETGDYAALTLGHTPGPEQKAAGVPEPEVVGFAGPFRLGVLGSPGERQRYAILADCHYYKADLDKVRKHPRRSPELWMEDRYEEMFFDPIALLGAEAPRLDMGLLYSARRHGRVIEKYAAACPSGGNTFVPSDDIRKDYSAAGEPQPQGGNMISPEDVKAIVDAVEQLPAMQWAKSQMGSAGAAPGAPPTHPPAPAAPPAPPGPPGMVPPAPGGAPPMGAAPPPAAPHPAPPPAAPAAPPMAAAPHPAPPAAPAPHPAPASPAPAAPAAAPKPPMAGPGPGSPPPAAAPKPASPSGPPSPSANGSAKPAGDAKPEPKKEEEPKKMAAQYAAGNGEGLNADDDYDAASDLEGDETRDHVIGDAKARYAAADDMFDDDDDFEQYAAYRKGRMKRYEAAAGSADAESGDPAPAAGDVEGRDGQPPKGSNADGSGEAASSYGGTGANVAEKYSRLASRVERYEKELADTRAVLESERAARIDAERLTTLVDLRMQHGVMIDPRKMLERLCYSRVKSDADFRERIDFILENGSNRMPMGRDLFIPDSEPAPVTATGIQREKFNKEHSDRARQICEAAAVNGQAVDYAVVLDEVRAGKR